MLRILSHSRRLQRSSAFRRQPSYPSLRSTTCETLEHRTLLTSTLYLDYGDNWPGGVLNTTVEAIADDINGPQLTDADGDDYDDDDTVAITSINTLLGSNAAAVRADMTAFTQRFYEPFDINVVDLTGTNGASNIAGIQAILDANDGGSEPNDTYLLIGGYRINGTDNPNSSAFGDNAYGGKSTGSDINGDNDEDGTAVVILSGAGAGAQFNGPQNAHEAGHAFGLEHIYRQGDTVFSAAYDMLHQSELMSYLGYDTQGGFNVFSRFPVMDGDGNDDDPDDLGNEPTPYNDLVDDPNIGASGIEYVTGSGAHDIITITKTGATTASVSLQAFTDSGYATAIDFPGGTGTTYTYSINTDRPLTIDAGGRNDRIILDGDLGNTITLRGMHGTDELRVMGKNAGTAVYTTGTNDDDGIDGNDDLRGSVQIGSTLINFQEFEPTSRVTIQDIVNLTFRTGGSDDSVTDTPGGLGGFSDGVEIVPLSYSNVQNLAIDTATNDAGSPNDLVTLDEAPIASLTTLAVNTGAGSDMLTLHFTPNPVPSGGLTFDGGAADAGDDLLILRDGTFATATYNATGPESGTIALGAATNITYTNLAPIDDALNVTDLTFNATASPDDIVIEQGTVLALVGNRIRSANGTFEMLDFVNKTNVTVNALGGGDTFDLVATSRPAGLATLTLNGGTGADTINFTRTVGAVGYTVNGGDGNDRVNVTGANLALGSTVQFNGDNDNDTFDVTSSPDVAIPVDGGGGSDTLKLNGETLTYAFTTVAGTTTFTRTGREPVTTVQLELLDLRNGTFTATNAVGPNVRVQGVEDGPATLNGTGIIAGTLTADPGGTVSPAVGEGVAGTLGAGSTALNAGSTLFVDLNGMAVADHDILNVTGTVNINSADLTGTVGIATIPGDEFVIIRNDDVDPVVGQFAQGFMVTIDGAKFTIDYAFVADADGQPNDVALIRYGAELAPDPCDPSQMALFVSATSTADTVTVLPVTGSSRVRVVIQNASFTDEFGPFDFKGQIIVMGQNGDDVLSTEQVPSRNVLMYGNAGNDTIRTGNNNGILLGNAGNDTLIGGNARDILIGGIGSDDLSGDNAGDILAGGWTKYDATGVDALVNRQALCDIMHEWQHGGRRSALLNAATVTDDNEMDVMTGGKGDDWYIVGLFDVLTDITKNEVSSLL